MAQSFSLKASLGVVVLLVLLALAAVVPILPDPLYHRERVPLLLWLAREIEELYTGERE